MRRRLCRGAHDYDINAGDWPACRTCGTLKYHRVSTDPDVGPPFGYADLPGRVNGTPYTETIMRWWQDGRHSPHPKPVAVDRALREDLPPWQMGWRVAIHDDAIDLPNHLIQARKDPP